MAIERDALLASTISALEQMPAAARARAAAMFIKAVQGPGPRPIMQIHWAAIDELHRAGAGVADIAAELDVSEGLVDLALQSHQQIRTVAS